ncbi:MAG: methyltransferase domain-containing protein [Acidobacteria bacterium]|nr:methyltransferase domain-containing protein [Acidobacteriota bacterium]
MNEETARSYDLVAARYAAEFQNELAGKPFDRKMLDWLIEKTDPARTLCDLGCGPGQIARYLKDRGADACGIDISPAMVAEAGRLHPDILFQTGDMTALAGVADGAFGGIAAFYSIIHVPRARLGRAFSEILRALAPGGVMLAAFHLGDETVHRDEWWGQNVSLDFNFLRTAEIREKLETAGFVIEEAIERDPYPDVEYQSRRAYVFARKPR